MPRKPKPTYTYRATVLEVGDGDTFRVRLDLGCRVFVEAPVRLLGVQAPERATVAGQAATSWVTDWLVRHPELVVTTEKDPEKYGRWLGMVVGAVDGAVLNVELVEAGHAVAWDGTGRRPV